jgi:hypothetical protein
LTRVSRKTEKNRTVKEQRIGQIKKARVGETVHGIKIRREKSVER